MRYAFTIFAFLTAAAAPADARGAVEALGGLQPADVRVIEHGPVIQTEYAPARIETLELHEVKARGERTRVRVEKVADSRAMLILFPGGKGVTKLSENGEIRAAKGNFLIRSRTFFLARGFSVAIPDGPSDHPKDLWHGFRDSDAHAIDIGAVIAHLRGRYKMPVWLLGTSRGSTSVASAASRLAVYAPDGIVLTASVLVPIKNGNHLFEFALDEIRMPVLIGHHRADDCRVTPPGKVAALARALTAATPLAVKWFDGGTPKGKACGARSEHGFAGIEGQVVNDIVEWILMPTAD